MAIEDLDKTILFVDDEKPILRALKRLFHPTSFTILLASTGMEALEILGENKVDMVISDMRMPEMDGYELLSRVKVLYPELIRIALSGYTDKKVVLSALKNNIAKIYMFKPWNNDEIVEIISGMFQFEAMLKDKKILDLISNISDIPTIPSLYQEVSRLIEEEASMEKIVDCIEKDQAIAARILRIANSAYFGSKTGDIKQAIMFIGLVNVNNIILSNAVYKVNGPNREALQATWEHSNVTNRLLNHIYSKVIRKQLPNDYRSAGLLHNIGKVVLMNEKEKFYQQQDLEDQTLVLRELEEIGVGHHQVSGYLLNWWELPLPLVESAFFHHHPMNEAIVNKELVMAVHVAQYYASVMLGMVPEGDLYVEALVALKMTREVMLEAIEQLS